MAGYDYILGETLHAGSSTRIVHGTHRESGVSVVLKIPLTDPPTEAALSSLRHEHAILQELAAPGVIRPLGLASHEHGLSLVLERWGDTSLDQLVAHGSLSVGTTLALGAAIARALGEVHRRGIIHRDIKPQNVLVDSERRAIKLIDFGLALHATRRVEATKSVDTPQGSLAYMAPEQTGRTNRGLDARADLYALGVTLYEMLTGTLPFVSNDAAELVHAHIARTPEPPHERVSDRAIPEAVSAIVLRLMEKSPEQRYQTAEGAAFDLERAAREWAVWGAVQPFALGTHDWVDRVRSPSRLFGRQRESAALMAAFHRIQDGAVELALVAGPSGVGKSALVHALRHAIRGDRGIFAPGKFDRLQRSTPYAAPAQALRQVVRRRLADPAPELLRWKQVWQEAAGPNGQILIDLMPELVHILGEPPPLVEVGPIEAKNRFQRTMLRFVRSIASAEHPLVLFIDDLQWADPASLVLIQEILTDPTAGHLLVVGAYRDDEIDASHPLHALVAAVQDKGVTTRTHELAPLDEAALASMVADMLDQPLTEVEGLARLVKEKTDGSPFFVGQFLEALHERGLLLRDAETGRLCWQREAIERAGITDNVVALLSRRLEKLPPATQRVLETAACIGNRFELELVSHIEDQDPADVHQALEEAAREGLLTRDGDAGHELYAFVHDRVQQAAYEARAPEERLAAHLSIGRQMRSRYGTACADAELFATIHHRNRAVALLDDAQEKLDLAAQNLRAAQRAKTSTAYAEARRFLEVARSLVGEAGFAEHYELTFEIHLCMAEATTLAGEHDEGERLFRICVERAADDIARARVVCVWMPLCTLIGRFAQGISLGLDALAWLGRPLPASTDALKARLDQMLDELDPVLARMSAHDWESLPVSADRAHKTVCKLLDELGLCSVFGQPSLGWCSFVSIVPETLQRGIATNSLSGLSAIAAFLTYVKGKISTGRALTKATLSLVDRLDVAHATPLYIAALGSSYWTPLSYAKSLFTRAEQSGAEEGNISFSEYGSILGIYLDAVMGAHLDTIDAALTTRAYRDAAATERKNILISTLAVLAPRRDGRADATPERAWADLVERAQRSAVLSFRFYAGTMASWVALHLGDDAEAARFAILAEPLWMTSWGGPPLISLTLSLCVAISHCADDATADERPIWQERFAFHRARLATFVEGCPETFGHMLKLSDAGRARREGQHEEAERLYDEAIDSARKHGFVNDEALGLRLAGEHYLARKRTRIARMYLRDAHDAYLRWGATAAAARLRERYPTLFAAPARDAHTPAADAQARTATTSTSSSAGSLSTQMDAATLLRAAQALSGDRALASLLERMLRLLAENAGAERAVLTLWRDETLKVVAKLSVEPEQMEVGLDEAIDGSPLLPATLIQYVARSHEAVVLGHAIDDGRFDEDPYLQKHRPASVLAVPLLHQGRLGGVMYLEHPRIRDAFPIERVEMVTLLASQAATAVENAALYAELQAYNERLAREVEERTAELKEAKEAADAANQAKSVFLASMSHELRTPLHGILGYAQILERSTSLAPHDRESIRVIQRSGEHLLTLINDVLDLAKIEAGRMDLFPREILLPPLLQTVVELCRVRAEQKGISFTFERRGIDRGVLVDDKRLIQVLLNLLGNAIKFTERGGVTLRAIAEDAGGAEVSLRFLVEDTGVGIAQEHLSRIFEPFEQVGARDAQAEGTGLGLAICKRIVDRMDGVLEVQSTLGKGSVFTVTLRVSTATGTAPRSEERSWNDVVGYRGERRAILVVDDSARNRSVMREFLELLGFDVREAANGQEAIRTAEEQNPSLILMDLRMAGMNGYEATRRLRQMPGMEKVVIIASSASVVGAEHEESARAGCDDFLAKPVEIGVLMEKLQRHLGLEWTYQGESARPPSNDHDKLARPSAEELSVLRDLLDKGRIRRLLEEADQLEQRNARLGPWIAELRTLAQSFQIRRLQALLEEDAAER